MKHAKRLFSVVLALAMLLAMAACTAEPEPQEEQEPAGTPVVETPEEDAAEEGAQAGKERVLPHPVLVDADGNVPVRRRSRRDLALGEIIVVHTVAVDIDGLFQSGYVNAAPRQGFHQ